MDFPIYSASRRSLRNKLLRRGVGGHIDRLSGRRPRVRALENVCLRFSHGDRIGLLGHNGAGKTTLLRVLCGAYEPTRGYVYRSGRLGSLLNVTLGMDRESTGYENIVIRGLYLGLTPKQARSRIDEIADFTELGDYLGMPLYTYSSGMRLRLAFAICTSFDVDILLMDEWLGVGDRSFLEKAKMRLNKFVHRAAILVLASHNRSLLERTCNKGVLLNAGRVQACGPIGELF